MDGRSYGLIPDGREMLSAGAAVARFFEIGVSRDFVNAPRRPGGDAVSRYGMGLSLVEAVPAAVERATGAARTSPLFVLVPILCLAGCAWAAARTLGVLGAARIPAAAVGAGLVLATPLWGYAGSDYGEPLQALCVTLSVLAVAELREEPASRGWPVVLGVAAGWAILTKTLLAIVVAPLLVAALFPPPATPAPRRRAASSTRLALPWPLLLSFAGILLLWLFLEIARFGRLGGGYGGETFTYPFFTGLLRLTLLPNKGLLWYAPLSALAVPGFLLLRRRDSRLALALAASALALLFASAAWWAWDGQAGWGPRLVLPALPCLVALAGVALAQGGRAWRVAGALALAAGVAVNALGALVPFPAVYALSSRVAPQPIAESRAAGTPYEIDRAPDGTLRATAPHHLSLTPAWSPIRIHALVLAARLKGGWDGSLPQLDPPFRPAPAPSPAPALRLAVSPLRVGWGREFFEIEEGEGSESVDPYRDALRDQLVRAIDMKDFARAASLGEELTKREVKISANDPRTVALVAESLRLGTGAPAALSYLSKKTSLLSSSSSCHAWILFVRAMAAPPGDFACLPEAQREAFAGALGVARQRGWTLTEWSRALTTGRP
ncbi:MAG: hypothetical protein IPL89_03310 [Acidobacteria bacterium]|nr:hypothetical protein [Acidobacteriota bacterium]